MGSGGGDLADLNQPSLLGKSQIGALSERHGPRICPSLFELIQFIRIYSAARLRRFIGWWLSYPGAALQKRPLGN